MPRWPWEFVKMGNCGLPIEIDEGWLVITHGVGAVRNYCMGACLPDRTIRPEFSRTSLCR